MKAKMKTRNVKSLMISLMLCVLFILLAGEVLAMGVGPSRQFISFAPGQKIRGELIVINDAQEDFRAAVYPQGALTEIINIEAPLVDVTKDQAMARVPYEINFPLEAPRPGEHTLELVVRQFPPDADVSGGATITANLALIAQIIVKAPYPGKYAEGKLFIGGNDRLETPTRFFVSVYNFGTEDIDEASMKVEIFGPTGEKVGEADGGKTDIPSKTEGKLEAEWTPEVSKGTYKAVATITYDGKQFKLEQVFNLGTFVIDVSDISVKKFKLGDVAKFDIILYNSWNTEMKDVYVEMTIEDSKGKEMTEFKTAAVDIPAEQAKTLEAYWYTEGVAPGVYKVKLLVHYEGKMTQKEYDFEVSPNSLTKLGEDVVGQAVTAEDVKEISTQGLIILLIIIVLVLLIGMNVAWFYFLSKKLMEREGGNARRGTAKNEESRKNDAKSKGGEQ